MTDVKKSVALKKKRRLQGRKGKKRVCKTRKTPGNQNGEKKSPDRGPGQHQRIPLLTGSKRETIKGKKKRK